MTSIDAREIEQFSQLAKEWWDEEGPLKGLHELNPVRMKFIKRQLCQHFGKDEMSAQPFEGLTFCDLGCGGGILSEPLTRLGAKVVGVDASQEAIEIAKAHAKEMGLKIDYQACDAVNLVKKKKKFDAVLSLEVVEHVANAQEYLSVVSALTKKEGAVVLSTLNKTWKSWALGIVVAENILGWAPKGAHQWDKFISPLELGDRFREEGVEPMAVEGMSYCPFKGWELSADVDVNYMWMGVKT